jgi:ribosome biogenesis GTPase A
MQELKHFSSASDLVSSIFNTKHKDYIVVVNESDVVNVDKFVSIDYHNWIKYFESIIL